MNRLSPTSLLLIVVLGFTTGCIELQEALQGALIEVLAGGAPGLPTDGDAPSDDPDAADSILVVTLSVSNPTPQLNEQVQLRCTAAGGDTSDVTFDFQPSAELVSIDRDAGTASLIIDAADLGTGLSFTCTGTNAAGTSARSSTQVILPTL